MENRKARKENHVLKWGSLYGLFMAMVFYELLLLEIFGYLKITYFLTRKNLRFIICAIIFDKLEIQRL